VPLKREEERERKRMKRERKRNEKRFFGNIGNFSDFFHAAEEREE
jgi:hypothetical protein